MSSSTPSSAMTFELRFDTPMIEGGLVGTTNSVSPLAVDPPLPGRFVWLSQRSGVFTPAEPLALDTTYVFTLRPGLSSAGGNPLTAQLRGELTTPPFSIAGFSPREFNANAASEPDIRLLFNAEVSAADFQGLPYFRDDSGRRILADVRQGKFGEVDYQLGLSDAQNPWRAAFERAHGTNSLPNTDATDSARVDWPTLLVVSPRLPLPVGKNWRLVVPAGGPARERGLRLRKAEEVPIGDITQFKVTQIAAHNLIYAGPSIHLEFSKPVPASLTNGPEGWLELSPLPTNLTIQLGWRSVVLHGDFQSLTNYTLKLLPGFRAEEPFELSGSNTFDLQMPSVAPRLYFPAFSRDQLARGNRTFPLLAINVPDARVRAKLLDPATAIHALRGYSDYFIRWDERRQNEAPDENYRPLSYNLIPGRTVFDVTIQTAPEPDKASRTELKWDELLHGRKTGVVFLDATRTNEGPRLGTQALIQLTDLGLVWKKSAAGTEVFAFTHGGAQPIAGATARLYSDENEPLAEALTDQNGIANLPANTNGDWVALQQGEDFHALPLDENRVRMWSYHLPTADADDTANNRRVLMFSDRRLYRPGEEVHLYALVRDWGDEGLDIREGLTGTLRCYDPHGRVIFKTNASFSSTGSWSQSIPLPISSRGEFNASLSFGTNDCYRHEFLVQDFQPSAFEVSAHAPESFAPAERVVVPVSARYFFGKPLSRARVKWTLNTWDTDFHSETFEAFDFGCTEPGSGRRSLGKFNSLTGDGSIGGGSNYVVAVDLPKSSWRRTASLLVEVTDLNQQTITHRSEFVCHGSDFYLGLRQNAEVVKAGEPLNLEIAAAAADGKPWPSTVSARLTLQRVNWESVRIQGAGKSVHYQNEAVLTNVLECDFTVLPVTQPAKAQEEIAGNSITNLPPLEAGEYLLHASATDPGGRTVKCSQVFYVSAPTRAGHDYSNDAQLRLKPDRKQYHPGDTAEILVEAPFSGTALVTVEREKVLRSYTTHLEGNLPLVRVSLTTNDVPNAFVSIALLRGSDDSPHQAKEPEYRLGYCELKVEDPATKLAVSVTPANTNCRPAETVAATIRVANASDEPVANAEVVVYAVDEGVASLNDAGLPDPHGFFHAPRPLRVQTGISLPQLLEEDPEELYFQNKGYLVGGGGEPGVRRKFLACAFWQAGLNTDTSGQVTVRFPAPDSITRYRLCAVAHAGKKQFGSAASAFRVSKPLLLEPALPAIANLADKLIARAVVQNQTTNQGDVLVSLELDDKVKAPAADRLKSRKVRISPNASAVVEFPVEFVATGTAKWIWKARYADPGSEAFTDAVESTIEVGHVVPLLREVLLDHFTAASTNLLSGANPQLLEGQGTITVTVANTRLNDLAEAASQLLHYPYGCAEQTGSSLLPWIVLSDAHGLLPQLRRGTNEMNTAIRSGVARLFSMQTSSGGLGYWPRASEPMFWASAYGGMVLALAQRHGIEVPEDRFNQVLKYLSQELRSTNGPVATSEACLALYTLALANRSEPAYHEKLFQQRETLSSEDRALLALAIAESDGSTNMVAELLKPPTIVRRWAEATFGCAARERAIRLLAWMRFRPDDRMLDRLVDDLMHEQKQANWGTTQGNAWGLLALTEYARRIESKREPVEGSLSWNGQQNRFHLDTLKNLLTFTFPATNHGEHPLLISKDSTNRLYTSVLIEARPRETTLPSQNRGFTLERRYQKLDENNFPHDLDNLRVGDRVLVTLNISTPEPASYVALDDALPSILEAVNPVFSTREASYTMTAERGGYLWDSDYHEIRKDRCLYFADSLPAGNYTLRYLARVRAAGVVTAPTAKIEEMYHPERFGLSGTQTITSGGFE